jgi:hypothetical protein
VGKVSRRPNRAARHDAPPANPAEPVVVRVIPLMPEMCQRLTELACVAEGAKQAAAQAQAVADSAANRFQETAGTVRQAHGIQEGVPTRLNFLKRQLEVLRGGGADGSPGETEPEHTPEEPASNGAAPQPAGVPSG